MLVIFKSDYCMQIKSLEVFLTVVRLGSFSEAANALHTVQSNVTSHIKKIETELGVEVLHRNPITLTRAGLQLHDYAEKIINLNKEMLDSFCKNKIVQRLPLKIGSMETTAAVRLPLLFQNLQKMDCDFPFSLITGPSRYLIEQVKSSQIDCAFIANPSPIEGLFNFHVWTENLVLIVPKSAPEVLSEEFLNNKKFIAFKQGCSYRRSIELFLSYKGLPAANILEIGSLDGIISCVSLDLGLAILPFNYVKQSHFYKEIKIYPIDESISSIKTYLVAGMPSTWGSNMHHFLEYLKKVTKND